jgi:hypothetical protein
MATGATGVGTGAVERATGSAIAFMGVAIFADVRQMLKV